MTVLSRLLNGSRPCVIRSRDAKGVALTEFAICLPLMFLLFACTVDIGLAIDTYFRYVQVARDAAFLGARLENLTINGSCTTLTDFSEPGTIRLSSVDGGCSDAKHLLMHDRANTLSSIFTWRARSVEFHSEVNPATASVLSPTVRFTARVEYAPLVLQLLGGIPVTIQVTTPLFLNGAALALSPSDESLLKHHFGISTCNPAPAGQALSQGLLVNLSEAVCIP